jgi:hypothetical protein
MPVLTYTPLGDAVQVGQPLGCDSTGWPYQVTQIEHVTDETAPPVALFELGPSPAGAVVATQVTVEPWPVPGPGASDLEKLEYRAAMHHAGHRRAGRIR